jgi:hypothetical protein
MDINWFNEKPKECVITLAAGSLTLNKAAANYFEHAYSVMLGIEESQKLFVIKPLNKAEAMKHDIPDNRKYKITVRSSYARVTNKAFVEELVQLFKIALGTEPLKFRASWNQKDQLMIVYLKEVL